MLGLYFLNMRIIILLLVLLQISCSTQTILKEAQFPGLNDDVSDQSLFVALKNNIDFLKKNSTKTDKFIVGKYEISKLLYAQKLQELLNFFKSEENLERRTKFLRENFYFLEVQSDREDKSILLTSYFTPVINGSFKKTSIFTQPIYRKPPSQIKLTREQIDSRGELKDENLEICYVGSIDAYFLHVQGAGVIKMSNGKTIGVGYNGDNGESYVSIGKILEENGVMSKEYITQMSLEAYIKKLNPIDRQSLFNLNPRYIFFERKEPTTTMGTPVVTGRTLASDQNHFPKGLVALTQFDKPIEFSEDKTTIIQTKKVSRLVVDQDTGSAIKGTGRFDLYWGQGDEAKLYSGSLKSRANVFYLLPRNNNFGHNF